MSYQILVLSDLHLKEKSNDARYPLFLDVLKKFKESSLNELILMGDIFDILIAPKLFWKRIHPEFFTLLDECIKQNKKILWVQGNHDFQLENLLVPMGIKWVKDGELLTRGKIKIYLTHGDLADKSATLHPLWRAFATSRFFAFLLKFIPERFGEKTLYPLSLKWSKSSRKSTFQSEKTNRARELFRDYAKNLSLEHSSHLVLLGHSHISDDYPLSDSSRYVNFGSWYEEAPLGILDIDGEEITIKVYASSAWLST